MNSSMCCASSFYLNLPLPLDLGLSLSCSGVGLILTMGEWGRDLSCLGVIT